MPPSGLGKTLMKIFLQILVYNAGTVEIGTLFFCGIYLSEHKS